MSHLPKFDPKCPCGIIPTNGRKCHYLCICSKVIVSGTTPCHHACPCGKAVDTGKNPCHHTCPCGKVFPTGKGVCCPKLFAKLHNH